MWRKNIEILSGQDTDQLLVLRNPIEQDRHLICAVFSPSATPKWRVAQLLCLQGTDLPHHRSVFIKYWSLPSQFRPKLSPEVEILTEGLWRAGQTYAAKLPYILTYLWFLLSRIGLTPQAQCMGATLLPRQGLSSHSLTQGCHYHHAKGRLPQSIAKVPSSPCQGPSPLAQGKGTIFTVRGKANWALFHLIRDTGISWMFSFLFFN